MDDYQRMSGRQRRALLDLALTVHGWVCCICGLGIAPGQESLQHVTPRSRGGTNDNANLRPAHRRCNSQAQDKHTTGPAGEIHHGLHYFAK